ncbi:MAG: bifunctional glutamate N-acetyltransferase/amino-acid acetyltransferase ArgJ [Pirellulales bacterium]|nr:bifunctional glutamate N-acetyltransferase/amino-acid acetyltransferase ArgJ [Pirellulales bacterium]
MLAKPANLDNPDVCSRAADAPLFFASSYASMHLSDTHELPLGFRAAGVYSGVKRNAKKLDLSLIVSDVPCSAAGVYTTNRVFGAPIAWNRKLTPGSDLRAVAMNAGVANACTGERGDDDARQMASLAALTFNGQAEQVLVLSTGVIGAFLPMDKIAAGIDLAAKDLATSPEALLAAARGIMTTDTVPKVSGRKLTLSGKAVHVTGLAKGAAMIAPRMATMLAVILTDASLPAEVAQEILAEAVDESFHCISVDGHMSTSDAVLLLANGCACASPPRPDDLQELRTAITEICQDLARAIPADGEGATHLVTIDIEGAADRAAARAIARTVAESPLVKTAIAGADPNWGRIVSAVGYADVPLDPNQISLWINDALIYENGAPVTIDEPRVSASIKENRETRVRLVVGRGEAGTRFWTTDLTTEYVRLNADYRT